MVEELDSLELEKSAAHPYTKKLLSSVFSVHDRNRKEIALETLSMEDGGYEKTGCVFQKRCPYAEERCRQHAPELKELAKGHSAACHRLFSGANTLCASA
ncbi:MAG: hypothetical protein IJU50_03465 [Lachnospiraceae bacterium]|nr:hypothetical protein [Lachnospiraceae bacterium]